MTIETLETYHHHLKDIDSLELQLIKVRNTVSSPNGKTNIGGRSLTPSNKTEQAALEAGELEEAF